jgi:tRNA-dihydrouridine synthase A
VPPLDYQRVYRLKQRLPRTFVGINGGIASLDEAAVHLKHVDGVMLGRAAYHTPEILADVDARFYGDAAPQRDVFTAMIPYIETELARGERLSHITRHMLGLFHGAPGARAWRRLLTVGAVKPGAGMEVVHDALAAVSARPERAVA